MELTTQEIKRAVHADSHTFARFRGRLHELRTKGQHRKADALQAEYNERLERWTQKLKNLPVGAQRNRK